MTYRLHELLKSESAQNFIESEWMDSILALHDLNRGLGTENPLTINQSAFGDDGPGYPLIKQFHSILFEASRPVRRHPKGLPSWVTHVGSGSIWDFWDKVVVQQAGFNEKHVKSLYKGVLKLFRFNDLYWKESPGSNEYYIRAWPADLTPLNMVLTGGQYKDKLDYRTEKRIAEESPKAEATLVVRHDISVLKTPDPNDPESFVRYVEKLVGIVSHKDSIINDLEALVAQQQAQIEELEKAKVNGKWATAAQRIEQLVAGVSTPGN